MADKLTKKSKLPIGIDLGTTQSCVAVYLWNNNPNNCIIVLGDHLKNQFTVPSCVEFGVDENDDIIVGEDAKYYSKRIENVVYDTKRIIGRNFNDPNIQKFIRKWTFDLKNTEKIPEIVIQVNNTEKLFCPTYVHSRIIDYMATTARGFQRLNPDERVDAVLTVPTYFTDSQRQETIRAADLANVNVISLLNEPTAAALAYQFGRNTDKEIKVLIFDFGGGTLDLSILSIINNQFTVLGNYGDTSIGGRDLDESIAEYALNEFQKLTNTDLLNDRYFRLRLLRSCELAKICLTSYISTKITVSDFREKIDFDRTKLNSIGGDLFERAVRCIDEVLKTANMSENNIDEVILIGGMAKIPEVVKKIENRFKGEKNRINNELNQSHAIAMGAALYAARLSDNPDDRVREINIQEMTALSLGTSVETADYHIMVPKGTKIPYSKTAMFTNIEENSESLRIDVFEGESHQCERNMLLGEFNIDIEPGPKETADISVTFAIDRNGILMVTAVDRKTNKSRSIKVENVKTKLNRDKYEEMMKLAAEQIEENERNKEFYLSKRHFFDKCLHYEKALKNDLEHYRINSKFTDEIFKTIYDNFEWLKTLFDRSYSNELEERHNKLNEDYKKFCANYSHLKEIDDSKANHLQTGLIYEFMQLQKDLENEIANNRIRRESCGTLFGKIKSRGTLFGKINHNLELLNGVGNCQLKEKKNTLINSEFFLFVCHFYKYCYELESKLKEKPKDAYFVENSLKEINNSLDWLSSHDSDQNNKPQLEENFRYLKVVGDYNDLSVFLEPEIYENIFCTADIIKAMKSFYSLYEFIIYLTSLENEMKERMQKNLGPDISFHYEMIMKEAEENKQWLISQMRMEENQTSCKNLTNELQERLQKLKDYAEENFVMDLRVVKVRLTEKDKNFLATSYIRCLKMEPDKFIIDSLVAKIVELVENYFKNEIIAKFLERKNQFKNYLLNLKNDLTLKNTEIKNSIDNKTKCVYDSILGRTEENEAWLREHEDRQIQPELEKRFQEMKDDNDIKDFIETFKKLNNC